MKKEAAGKRALRRKITDNSHINRTAIQLKGSQKILRT
jgi:hypothetical protein